MPHKVSGDDAGGRWNPVVIAIVSAIIGSGGGVALVFNTPIGAQITRPDPFTGSQAASLESRIGSVERGMSDHLLTHPDRALELRVTILESNYNHLIETLDRIEKKLDKQ